MQNCIVEKMDSNIRYNDIWIHVTYFVILDKWLNFKSIEEASLLVGVK